MTVTQQRIRRKAPLSIQFLIVGGGVGGYAAAVALAQVGHRVQVLEQETNSPMLAGSSRVSPNMSKILFSWGLEEECRRASIVSRKVVMSDYKDGKTWGYHRWDDEILKETRGVFLLMHQTDVRDILKERALRLGVSVRERARISDVFWDGSSGETRPGVRLSNGEVLHSDVLVGADGRFSTVREKAFKITDPRTPTGQILFDVTVPIPEIAKDPELARFLGNWQENSIMLCSVGNLHATLANPVGGSPEYSMHIWVPDNGRFSDDPILGTAVEVSANSVIEVMGKSDPILKKLVELSTTRLRTKVVEDIEVEDWIHPDAPIVLIGGAAHTFKAGAVYSRSMAVEDAACFAEIFSHLAHMDQVRSFMNAFQEIRQPRTDQLRQMEDIIVRTMTTSDDKAVQLREAQMKAALEEGKGVMSNFEFDQLLYLFAYEAEDEANNWWVKWGLLSERLRNREVSSGFDVAVKVVVH